jgi:hypothetical protein
MEEDYLIQLNSTMSNNVTNNESSDLDYFKDLLSGDSSQLPQNNEALLLTPSSVDNIEDAILAALEAAQTLEELPTQSSSSIPLGGSDNAPLLAPPPFSPFQPPQHLLAGPQKNSVSSAVAQNIEKQINAIQAHPLHPNNLRPLFPPSAPVPTGPPAMYIAGIFGSLAGVADNTIKLLASSSNAIFGVASGVTCQFNPNCSPRIE